MSWPHMLLFVEDCNQGFDFLFTLVYLHVSGFLYYVESVVSARDLAVAQKAGEDIVSAIRSEMEAKILCIVVDDKLEY